MQSLGKELTGHVLIAPRALPESPAGKLTTMVTRYEKTVNPFPPKTITPRQIVEQIRFAEADLVDCHVAHRPTDEINRLLRALRAAAITGEFLVEIGGVR